MTREYGEEQQAEEEGRAGIGGGQRIRCMSEPPDPVESGPTGLTCDAVRARGGGGGGGGGGGA